MHQEYPKWLYDGLEGIIVESAEEEASLGEGYSAFPVEPGETAHQPRRGRHLKAKD